MNLENEIILDIKNLMVDFSTDAGDVRVLDGISFQVERGKTLGIVGESGCGKSVTAMSIMRLLPYPYGKIKQGDIDYFPTARLKDIPPPQKDSYSLTRMPLKQLQKLRGNRISMIFQDPMTALNPVKTIGQQLLEVYLLHRLDLTKHERNRAALEMLEKVGIPSADKRFHEYPHQLSGGMRQRVVIAMALACEPDILICDEPTTALDVTVQAQILDLMQTLQQEKGMSIIFITHDLGVIAQICDQVVVMYAGQVVEKCDVFELFDEPKHPYTKGLLSAIPTSDAKIKSKLTTIIGSVPSLDEMPKGCRFSNRCSYTQAICHQKQPQCDKVSCKAGLAHQVACHQWQEI